MELLGGDPAKRQPQRESVEVLLTQLGRQRLRRKVGVADELIVSVDAAPFSFDAPFAPLVGLPAGKALQFGAEICDPQPPVNFVPTICPSPCSTYSLSEHTEEDAALDEFLATVQTVRVHGRVTFPPLDCARREDPADESTLESSTIQQSGDCRPQMEQPGPSCPT